MQSVWTANTEKPEFNEFSGDIKTYVLIIGGGIAGILCGYILKNRGVDCVIAEAKSICSGVTQNTTAKVTYHHGAIFDKMIKRYGLDFAKQYVKANETALKIYRDLCKNIDCDFTEKSSFVYSLTDKQKILNEAEALRKIGCKAEFVSELPLPFKTVGAVCLPNQAEFNPIKFLFSVANDLKIFENTKILEILPDGASTDKGKITADKIIVATHFPFANKYGGYFLKMYQHRSYVLAVENNENLNGMYVDENDKGMSFRNYKDLLLIGGGGHRTGKQGGGYAELEKFAKRHYPNSKIKYRWATQDCKTLDDIPYIGQYSKRIPNVFVTTGFNKWGMTSAMVSANLLADLIEEKENEFSEIFAPTRSILHSQFAINTFETAKSLLTPTAPRCPHLGCALKYNKQEHSWDCPCHGSRFSDKGQLLDNPATDDIKL